MLKGILIQADAIQLQIEPNDWEDALAFAALPLVKNGFIEKSYFEAIVNSTLENGAYYVFEDERFALPYARPEDGVNKVGFSLVTFKNPISINGSPEINFMIMLCAVDSDSHIKEGLQPIMEMLNDEQMLKPITTTNKIDEVLALL